MSNQSEENAEPLVINGSSSSDCLVGTADGDLINGDAYNDILADGVSNDRFFGGAGDDMSLAEFQTARAAAPISRAKCNALATKNHAGDRNFSAFLENNANYQWKTHPN
jgi:Ca2+-binding RTX toxin-like protein